MAKSSKPAQVLREIFTPADRALIHAKAMLNLVNSNERIPNEEKDAAYFHYLSIKNEIGE